MESPMAGMAPNDLTASIIADAHAKAREIDEETARQVRLLRDETDRLQSERRERYYDAAKRKQEELREQAQAKQDLDAVRLALAERQCLIDEALADARNKLERLPAEKRKRLIAALWSRASSRLMIASVVTCQKDAAFFRGKCRVTVKESLGGFRATSPDGKVSVDFRLEGLLDDLKARKTAEIASILFGEQKGSPAENAAKRRRR